MSMMDSGIGFANPLSPLHQRLMQTMPNTLNTPPQVGADDEAGMLMRAHNLRAGNPAAGQMSPGSRRGTPGGSGSPVGTSLSKYKTMMMSAAGLSDDDRNKFKDALDDPSISPAALKDLLVMHQKAKTMGHHDFDGTGAGAAAGQQALPNNGASIGGAAPASLKQGSIQITRGHGPNAMSEDAMQQWAGRAQQAAGGAGEQFMRVQNDEVPRTSFFQKPTGYGAAPGSQYAGRGDITRGPLQGFQVNGIQAPQQPAPQGGQQADPVVGMYQALQQAGADPQGLAQWKAFAQAGASPEQLHMAAQHLMGQQQSAQGHQAAQQEKAQQQASQQEQHRNDLMLRQLQHQQTLAAQYGKEEEVASLQQKIDGLLKPAAPQQQQPTRNVGQPTPNQGQYKQGQTINTPKGPVMVVGFDRDGHPLIQPAGK